MAITPRETAIVRLIYAKSDRLEPLPLDKERPYETIVTIKGTVVPSGRFSSPLGDEMWRNTITAIRNCSSERRAEPEAEETEESAARRRNYPEAVAVRGVGHLLYASLEQLCRPLARFLESSGPRRLVIESARAEIHALPWEAMVDANFTTPAAAGLSVVRATDSFNEKARPSPELLYVVSRRGPGVPDDAIASVRSIGLKKEWDGEVGVIVSDRDEPPADLVHVIAHGSPDEATTAAGQGEVLRPEQLASQYAGRLMILLRSCFSAKIPSTGVPPAMALHDRENLFVLAFAAPLNFGAGNRIATRFYSSVFGVAGHQDPERAVTEIRADLFAKEFEFCDWASMTLWLKKPIDLSPLPLGRVRVPAKSWNDAPIDTVNADVQQAVLDAALGDVRVVEAQVLSVPLTRELVASWAGPVLLLDGPNALADDAIFEELDLRPDRSQLLHPADLFLYLIDELADYPRALVVWSGIGHEQLLLLQTLDRLPSNIGFVLVSPFRLAAGWPGRMPVPDDANQQTNQPIPSGREGFLYLVSRDRYAEALAHEWTDDEKDVEAWSARYQAHVRTKESSPAEQRQHATTCIEHLRKIDEVEAHLLSGNLESRETNHLAALEAYQRASKLAIDSKRPRELGRARQEMAFLADDMGDRGRAAELYRSAMRHLQDTPAADRNSLWTSAIARVHRDYAHLLATEGRGDEALRLLRRAIAIHAVEGRWTQLAYCFVTRSEALLQLGRYDEADRAAQQAAIVFDRRENRDGWIDAIRRIAHTASARSHHAHAMAVLRRAACRPLRKQQLGRPFLQMAEVCWNAGQIDEAAFLARRVLATSGNGPRRADASRLEQVTRCVAPSPPRVAALGGRMLREDAAFNDSDVERLQESLSRCLLEERVDWLISSAARGADLVALEIAERMGIRRTIVLPFEAARFKETSVGRNPEWIRRFDKQLSHVRAIGGVIELNESPEDGGYAAANEFILQEANRCAVGAHPLVIIVWEGQPKTGEDITANFRKRAVAESFDIRDVIL